MANKRVQAVEAYVSSMRTGEPAGADRASRHLAPDVVLTGPQVTFEGHDEVLTRITGSWPLTPLYLQAGWSDPYEEGDTLKVDAELGVSATSFLTGFTLTFSFNDKDQICRVEQENQAPRPPAVVEAIPNYVRGMVNGALANGTPMSVAYVDADGAPHLSLRGSVQAYSGTQLGIWVRPAEGGIAKAVEANPNVALLYRDSRTRTNLVFSGQAHVEADAEVRDRLFEMTPEVEQNHDPARKGSALIIDVTRLQGGTMRGTVRLERTL